MEKKAEEGEENSMVVGSKDGGDFERNGSKGINPTQW